MLRAVSLVLWVGFAGKGSEAGRENGENHMAQGRVACLGLSEDVPSMVGTQLSFLFLEHLPSQVPPPEGTGPRKKATQRPLDKPQCFAVAA